MARNAGLGICRLCGVYKQLSYEHVPPQAAFNDQTVFRLKVENYYSMLDTGERITGFRKQGGWGYNTLCVECNNFTGRWYAPHFIDWCKQGMILYEKTNGNPTLIYIHRMRPLAILKQIATMFLALNENATMFRNCRDLCEFVGNVEKRHLPERFGIYTFFHAPGPNRANAISSTLDIEKGGAVTLSEFTYPPFGYVMTFDSEPPDPRLYNISHFGRRFYNDFDLVKVDLPVLPTHGPMSGDYRKFRDFSWDRKEPKVFVTF